MLRLGDQGRGKIMSADASRESAPSMDRAFGCVADQHKTWWQEFRGACRRLEGRPTGCQCMPASFLAWSGSDFQEHAIFDASRALCTDGPAESSCTASNSETSRWRSSRSISAISPFGHRRILPGLRSAWTMALELPANPRHEARQVSTRRRCNASRSNRHHAQFPADPAQIPSRDVAEFVPQGSGTVRSLYVCMALRQWQIRVLRRIPLRSIQSPPDCRGSCAQCAERSNRNSMPCPQSAAAIPWLLAADVWT